MSMRLPSESSGSPEGHFRRRGELSILGWGMGVSVLGIIAIAGIMVGYVIGASRPETRSTRTEIAVAKPTVKESNPVPKPTEPARKEPAPKKELPKKEPPPKKELPKKEPPKKEEPKKPEPTPTPPQTMMPVVTFAKDILPIFENRCVECHQPLLKKGGLDLKTLVAIEKGGNGGKALTPGKLEESLIWKTIEDGEMPPAGKKPLTDAEKKLISDWIKGGGK